MKKLLTIVLAVVLMAVGSVASAASIGVNMGSNQMALASGDTAGVVAQTNWNNATNASGSLSNVNNNSGTATTLDVSWSAVGTWNYNSGTSTGNYKMMYGYLDPGNSSSTSIVTLTEIPYTVYDVYVYVGGDNYPTGKGKITNGTTTYSYSVIRPFAGTFTITTDTGSAYPSANYAKFAGLTGSSKTITCLALGLGDNTWSGIFGVQIVEVASGPGAATSPSPANGATNVAVTTDLSWTAGAGATSHNVYFGTVSPGTSRGNQTATTYDTGTMPNGTVHYWRIDEVNAGGTTTGTVWSFTTVAAPSYKATVPSPSNGATTVAITADLSWTAGVSAAWHDVYFGTSQTAVAAASRLDGDIDGSGSVDIEDITVLAEQWLGAPGSCGDLDGDGYVDMVDFAIVSADWLGSADSVYKGNQTGTSFDPGTLANSTTYYWRIDEVNCAEGDSPWAGDVWSFTTVAGGSAPGAASSPSPANGATAVSLTADLSWTAGSGATSHNVYFGTASPGTSRGNQAATTYDAGTMTASTVYYWRIDEVNAYGTTTGTVWSFTTADGAANEGSIGINLGSNEVALATGDVAGVTVTQSNWNNASGGSGSLSDVNNADGTATTMDASWGGTSPGTWHVTANGTATGDGKLMNGYLDAGDQLRSVYVTLSQIPYGTYNLYVYVGGSNSGAKGNVTDGTTTYSLMNGSINPGGDGFQAADYVRTTDTGTGYPSANYALFEECTGSSRTVTIGDFVDIGMPSSDEAMGIFAVQIVEVFTAKASNPSPANGATSVSLTADLSWNAGISATSHNVYFGTSSPGTFQGNQAGTTFDPGTMSTDTTYYWRIDEIASGVTTTGNVWSFTTVTALASSPSPANGAGGVGIDDNLSWLAGSGATSHNVYFGTSSPGTFRGNQSTTTYDPGTMSILTTYYWRIDEINAYGTTTGTVWNFTTYDNTLPRVIISSDIGGYDNDDRQSMVHYLVYANMFSTEGLVSSPPGPGRASAFLELINYYETDYSNLCAHGSFPTPNSLRNVTKQGATDPAPSAGYSSATEGSNWIITRANVSDARPLWVLTWGSITDVAQAVHDNPGIKSKIRVISTGSWNTMMDTYARAYLYDNHSDMWWIESNSTMRGMYLGGDHSGDLDGTVFRDTHVCGHGALGDYYCTLWTDEPLKMGDTPVVMYLLNGNRDVPTTPHWGGMYGLNGHGSQFWTDLTDPIYREEDCDGAKTVNVWREAFLRDWQGRMDWADGQ